MADDSKRLPSTSSEEEEYHVYRLRIHDASKDDAGVWGCEVEDKFGAVSTTCSIDILEEVKKRAIAAMRQASLQEEAMESYKSQNLASAEKSSTQVVQNGTADSEDEGEYQPGTYDENYITKFMNRSVLLEEEPSFVQSLRNTKVQEGRDFRLTCRVNGNPKPGIKWFKNNVEIVNDKKHRTVSYHDGMTFLEVKNANIKLDSKVYRCEITSCLGISSTEARITVMESKDFEIWDQNRGEYDVNIASIQKQSKTDAVKKVQIDDSSVSDRVLKRLKSEERSLHELYSRQRESVLKLNIHWEDSQRFFFVEHLKSKCVVDGAALSLSCFVSGISPFFVMWYKDNKPMMNNVYERYHIKARGGHLSLEIPCTNLDDTGEYSCEVRNEQGHIVSACYVQVEPMTDPYIEYCRPYFAKNVHSVRIEYGGSVTFSCVVKGSPKPGLTWFKDGRALNQSNKITMHSGEKGLCLLKIHDTDYTDIGLYKCEAHNMAGRCQSSANLIVFGEPTPRYRRISLKEEEEVIERERDFTVAVFDGEDMYLSQNSKDIFVKPPGFTRSLPPTMTVKEGQMIFFDCRAEGFPRPTGQWFFEGELIKESNNIRIIGVKNIHTLEIKTSVSSRDSGKYTLKLKNPSGETCYSNCNLTVVSRTTEIVEEEITSSRAKGMKSAISSKSKWAQKLLRDEEEEVKKSTSKSKSERVAVVEEENTKKAVKIEEVAAKVVEAAVSEAKAEVNTDVVDAASKSTKKKSPVETAKEVPFEAKEAQIETAKEAKIETAKEAKIETAKEAPSEAAKEAPVEAATEAPVETVKETPVVAVKEAPVETAQEAPVETAKEAVVEAAKEIPVEAAKEVPTEVAKEAPVEQERGKQVEEITPEKPCVKAEEEMSSPSFVQSLQPEYSFVDTAVNVKFSCKVTGNPPPTLAWWKGGTQLETGGNINIDWNANTGEGTLVFKSLSLQDSGKYECVASSTKGSCISSTVVSVTKADVAPTVVQGLEETYDFVEHETSVKLTCKWKGHPVPTVEWYKDGKKLSSSDTLVMEWSSETGVATLVLKALTIEMSGSYECVATSSVGTAKSATNVTIKRAEMKPTAIEVLQKEYSFVETDKNVRLQCKWDGYPSPSMEWYKDGKKLSPSDNLVMEWNSETGEAFLVLKSLSMEMSGSYECVASSFVGTAKSATNVTIKRTENKPTATEALQKEYNFLDTETNVRLQCKWDGYPRPSVEWYKDGKKLSSSDNLMVEWSSETGVASMVFKYLSMETSGSYECVATSSAGTTKSDTNVTVKRAEKKPTATEGLQKEYSFVDTDTNVRLQCKWDGYPSPTVEWYKDGKKLSSGESFVMEWSSETGVASLVFKSMSMETSGRYECVATSSVGTARSATDVTVKRAEKKPAATEGLQNEYSFVDTDTNVRLKCKWDGYPCPSVEWYKDGKKLSSSDNLVMEWSSDTGVASLVFKSMSMEMSGSYECVATSSAGTTKSATNVTVKKPEKKPEVLKSLDKTYEFKLTDTNVKLQCQVEGNPAPQISWMKDGQPLKDSERVKFEWNADTGVAALVFASLGEKDSGNYECVASSSLGTTKSPAAVTVKKPEKAPTVTKPLETEYTFVETDTNIKIQCQMEGNPVPEISWMKDGMKLEAGGRIKFEWNADTGLVGVVFRKLNLMDSGSYECIATSSLGTTKSSTSVCVNKPDKTPEVLKPLLKEYNFQDTDSNVRLQCQVDGSPLPDITWFKDGKPVEAGKRVKPEWNADTGSAALVFSRINQEDSGTYECVAKSRVGETKCATSVTVKKPEKKPEVVQPLKRQYSFTEGEENVCLQCMMEGYPPPQVEWYRGGVKVEPSDNISFDWDADSGVASMTFKTASCEDSGNYECVAASSLGKTKSPTTLQIKKPEKKPAVLEPLKSDYNYLDTDVDVRLQCKLEGYPVPSVEWLKDGKKLTADSNLSVEWNAETGVASLVFKTLSVSDTGKYECVAKSAIGKTQSATSLTIKQPEKKPTVVKDLAKEYNFLDTDKNVCLQCQMAGYPEPKVTWLKDGKKLEENDNLTFEWNADTGVAAIKFKNLNFCDTGKYECVATSTLGTTTSATAVSVKRPETMPTVVQPLEPEYTFDEGEENVSIVCKFEGYPAPTLSWSQNGKKLKDAEYVRFDWNSETGVAAMVFTETMSPLDTGSYECIATSPKGTCKSTTQITVTKPIRKPNILTPLETEYNFLPNEKNVRLQCKIDGNPSPDVYWVKNGEKMVDCRNAIFKWNENTGKAAMILKKVGLKDAGEYQCVGFSNIGSSKTTTTINVQAPEQVVQEDIVPKNVVPDQTASETGPPVFTDMAVTQTVPVGGTAVFKCIIISHTAAEFIWKKDGVNLSSNDRVIIKITEKETSLTIAAVELTDRGTYTCVAQNQYGHVETSGNLLVDEKENLIKAKRRKTWSGEILSSEVNQTEMADQSKKITEGDFVWDCYVKDITILAEGRGDLVSSIEETDGSLDSKVTAKEIAAAEEVVQTSETVGMAEQQTEVSMVREQAKSSESAAVVEASGQKQASAMVEQTSTVQSSSVSEQAVSFSEEESSAMKTEKISSSSQSSQEISMVKESSEQVSVVSASQSSVESRTESVMSSDKAAAVMALEDFESSVSKLKETMSQVTVQESRSEASASSSMIEILEVKAVPAMRAEGSVTEGNRHRHKHQAPELIIPAHSQQLPEHSDIELMVKVKASKSAQVKWLHDGKTVSQSGHYEMSEEEQKINE